MVEKAWEIVGYDSSRPIFREEFSYRAMSHDEVRSLLQRLACRHLSDKEIFLSSLPEGTAGRRRDLDVMPNNGGKAGMFTTGNPHYSALVKEA